MYEFPGICKTYWVLSRSIRVVHPLLFSKVQGMNYCSMNYDESLFKPPTVRRSSVRVTENNSLVMQLSNRARGLRSACADVNGVIVNPFPRRISDNVHYEFISNAYQQSAYFKAESF